MDAWKKVIIGLLIVLSPALCVASTPTVQVASTANQFLAHHYEPTMNQPPKIYVGPVDPHLELPSCHKPLQAFLPNNADPFTTHTIGVRCPETNGWTIYVPVQTQLEAQALNVTHTLSHNDTLIPDEVAAVDQNSKTLPFSYVNNLTQIVGKVAHPDLAKGATISSAALKNPIQVQRSNMVTSQVQELNSSMQINGSL